MNGYLVLARCTMDDVPMRFFHCWEIAKAKDYAKGLTLDAVKEVSSNLFRLEPSDLFNVSIIEYKDGFPVLQADRSTQKEEGSKQ